MPAQTDISSSRIGQAAGSKDMGQDGRRETLGVIGIMFPFSLYYIKCFPYIVFSYEHVLSYNQKKRIQPEITPNIPQYFPGPQPPRLSSEYLNQTLCGSSCRSHVGVSPSQPSPDPSDQLRRTPDSHPTSPPADRGGGGWCSGQGLISPRWMLLKGKARSSHQ